MGTAILYINEKVAAALYKGRTIAYAVKEGSGLWCDRRLESHPRRAKDRGGLPEAGGHGPWQSPFVGGF